MPYSSVIKQSGEISSTEALPILYDLYVPAVSEPETLPVLLFLHGFKGSKDWGPFPDACEELCRTGFAVVAFNFSHSGMGLDVDKVEFPDRFRTMTVSQDVADVKRVIQALREVEIRSEKVDFDTSRIGLVGHSRGGHTAIIATGECPEVQCLVTWGAVADFMDYWSPQMVQDWAEKGETLVQNIRTGQTLPLGREGYDDLLDNSRKMSARHRVREIYVPVLFIAGKKDESVPCKHTETLYLDCPSDTKELRLIANTGHTFGAQHPFQDQDFPEPFAEALNFTEDWVLEHLS